MPIKPQSLLTQATEYNHEKPLREWYFAFCENQGADIPKWQQFFIRKDPPGLTHVYAFTQAGPHVLFVEPFRDRIDFNINYPEGEEERICAEETAKQIVNAGHFVVRHIFTPNINDVKSVWNWIPTCVTVVKAATGYPSTAWTPRHLLLHLLDDGALIIRS